MHDLMHTNNFSELLRKPLEFLNVCTYLFYLFQGWQRASSILCLGSLQLEWTKKKFPWLDKKLNYYLNALTDDEQILLATIRSNRKQFVSNSIKFLWIGL
jgi:hypothetical protein